MSRVPSSDSIANATAVSSDADVRLVDTASTSPRIVVPLPQVGTVGLADDLLVGGQEPQRRSVLSSRILCRS